MIGCDDDYECPCDSGNGAVWAALIGALGGVLAAGLPAWFGYRQAQQERHDNLLATAVRGEASTVSPHHTGDDSSGGEEEGMGVEQLRQLIRAEVREALADAAPKPRRRGQ